jgi:hypothetical protein
VALIAGLPVLSVYHQLKPEKIADFGGKYISGYLLFTMNDMGG